MKEIRAVGAPFLVKSLVFSKWLISCICTVEDYPDLWVHVDAAWAGVALACHELREQLYLDDINGLAHSFCTNFHKVNCFSGSIGQHTVTLA